MTDAIQQLRTELDETVSENIDMLISINTALQNVSAKPVASKPHIESASRRPHCKALGRQQQKR